MSSEGVPNYYHFWRGICIKWRVRIKFKKCDVIYIYANHVESGVASELAPLLFHKAYYLKSVLAETKEKKLHLAIGNENPIFLPHYSTKSYTLPCHHVGLFSKSKPLERIIISQTNKIA